MIAMVFSAVGLGLLAGIGVHEFGSIVTSHTARRTARGQLGLAPRRASRQRWSVTGVRARRLARRRNEQISAQLSPALSLIVGNLRIGRNVLGAISEVIDTVSDPLQSILREIVTDVRLGEAVEEVVMRIAQREANPHLAVVASALSLHAHHGGSLVEILETVAETIEEEDRLVRDVRSLTADARLSAIVLMVMPLVAVVVVTLLSPGYMAPLVTEPAGQVMSVSAVLLGVVGWRWLRALGRPEVTA
jgi:tight adherence protein B